MYACNGICLTESLTGRNLVTRKITRGMANIAYGIDGAFIGNLDALRDWGHAKIMFACSG